MRNVDSFDLTNRISGNVRFSKLERVEARIGVALDLLDENHLHRYEIENGRLSCRVSVSSMNFCFVSSEVMKYPSAIGELPHDEQWAVES